MRPLAIRIHGPGANSLLHNTMKTMKALVKAEAKPGLWLQEVPIPSVGINDVLIRVHKTGICGTDLHIYKWDAWAQKTIPVPMVVGHRSEERRVGKECA